MPCSLRVAIITTLIAGLAGKDVESNINRIIGGNNDVITKRPYIVSVQDNNGHKCGGTIIAKYAILTANHCVPGGIPTKYKIYSGSSYTFKNDLTTRVKRIYRERESPTGRKADVAILELEKPLVFGPTRQPIALWHPDWKIYIKENVLVSGWGLTLKHSNDSWNGQLQTVVLELMAWRQCATVIPRQLKVHEVCIWVRKDRQDSCAGDSGGPVVIDDGKKRAQLAIVAGGWDCGQPGVPGIYTNIAYVRSWIDRTLRAVELLNK